jgi:hypothetical protein
MGMPSSPAPRTRMERVGGVVEDIVVGVMCWVMVQDESLGVGERSWV